MPELLAPLIAGFVAGLGIAVPLGAIGVLVVNETLDRGWRAGFSAGLGVAIVDLFYAIAAILLGATVHTLLDGHAWWIRMVAAATLATIAIRGIRRSRRPLEQSVAPRLHGTLRFMATTAVNPVTAIYFTVIAATPTAAALTLTGTTAYLIGVFAASAGWHTALVSVTAIGRHRLTARGRRITAMVGYAIVIALALKLLLLPLW